VALGALHRAAHRLLGGWAARRIEGNPGLGIALQRARMHLRPEVYLATAMLLGLVVGAAALAAVGVLAFLALGGSLGIPARFFLLLGALPVVAGATGYLLALLVPAARALGRARDIEAKLPYAINYIATMASAGATPDQVFAGLARQQVYGEVAREAAGIARDVRILGADVVTALQHAIERSPSAKMQDFLQGTVTTLASGGDLRSYFAGKSEQYLQDNRHEQRKFLDSLGVLAESFVTVVVAAPLFLIVILSVMSSFGSPPSQTLALGYALVFLVIPLAQAGFAWTIKVMTPEA
jgi:archaeal flagellar protein FlaJ